MRKALAVSCGLWIALLLLPIAGNAGTYAVGARANSPSQHQVNQDSYPPQNQNYPDQYDQNYQYVPYSPEQLDNLLAPIALYPDPLLAQVLPAATFTDQIDEAARYVQAYGEDGVDDQPWDVSVRSVAHYPDVLYMMDERMDWTTAVGQAYVNQSTDVMMSIQRLRRMAYDEGNLVSTPQWQIVYNEGYIQIWPASPEYIYVPTYDPAIIYYQRCYYNGGFSFGFSFGRGFHIGIWLNRDADWRHHRFFYTGWRGNEEWQRRARPYVERNDVRVRNVYINNNINVTNIRVNRTVVNRVVNVQNINRYDSVHRGVNFNNVSRNRGGAPAPGRPQINNRVINRNIYTGDPRLNQFRGHAAPLPGRPQEQNFRPAPPRQARPENQPPARQPQRQPQYQTRPQYQQRQFQPAPQQYRPAERPAPHAFGTNETIFNPRAAQQRGAQSRQQMSRPVQRFRPPPRPAPRSAPRPQSRRPARSRPHGHGGEL